MRHISTLWGDGNVLCLECDGGYAEVSVSQKSSICTFRMGAFYVCQLCLNKIDLKRKEKC